MIKDNYPHKGELFDKIIVDICTALENWLNEYNLIKDKDYGDFCGKIAERSFKFNQELFNYSLATEALQKNHKKNKNKSHLIELLRIIKDIHALSTRINENKLLHTRDKIKKEKIAAVHEYPFMPEWEAALEHFGLCKTPEKTQEINKWLFQNFPLPEPHDRSRLEHTSQLTTSFQELILYIYGVFLEERQLLKDEIRVATEQGQKDLIDIENIINQTTNIEKTVAKEMKSIIEKTCEKIGNTTEKYNVYIRKKKGEIELDYLNDLADIYLNFTGRSNLIRTTKEKAQHKTSPFNNLVSICYETIEENLTEEGLKSRLKVLKKHREKNEI